MPSVFVDGAVQFSVTLFDDAGATVMAKTGKVALSLPSLTLIDTLEEVPTSAATGVPYSVPFVVSNDAQVGCC